jgi:hypothetical protein
MATTSDNNFAGFGRPDQNWFKMPNNWTDVTAGMQSWAEQKVVEYVLRHTWGYREYGLLKRISLDEFEHGRRRSDGTRMDRGVGLGRQAVISGLKLAVQDGFLVVEKDESDKARVKKSYGLKMAIPSRGYDGHTPGVRSSHSRGVKITHRTKKDTLERHSKKDTTVANGDNASPVMRLPRLDQPLAKTAAISEDVLDQLGDKHSQRLYDEVAARVPEQVIRKALAEIKADGAEHPPKVFTFRMNQYALRRLRGAVRE